MLPFSCAVCFGATIPPVVLVPCGHIFCGDCTVGVHKSARAANAAAQMNILLVGTMGARPAKAAPCPTCRSDIKAVVVPPELRKLVALTTEDDNEKDKYFMDAYRKNTMPEKAQAPPVPEAVLLGMETLLIGTQQHRQALMNNIVDAALGAATVPGTAQQRMDELGRRLDAAHEEMERSQRERLPLPWDNIPFAPQQNADVIPPLLDPPASPQVLVSLNGLDLPMHTEVPQVLVSLNGLDAPMEDMGLPHASASTEDVALPAGRIVEVSPAEVMRILRQTEPERRQEENLRGATTLFSEETRAQTMEALRLGMTARMEAFNVASPEERMAMLDRQMAPELYRMEQRRRQSIPGAEPFMAREIAVWNEIMAGRRNLPTEADYRERDGERH